MVLQCCVNSSQLLDSGAPLHSQQALGGGVWRAVRQRQRHCEHVGINKRWAII